MGHIILCFFLFKQGRRRYYSRAQGSQHLQVVRQMRCRRCGIKWRSSKTPLPAVYAWTYLKMWCFYAGTLPAINAHMLSVCATYVVSQLHRESTCYHDMSHMSTHHTQYQHVRMTCPICQPIIHSINMFA